VKVEHPGDSHVHVMRAGFCLLSAAGFSQPSEGPEGQPSGAIFCDPPDHRALVPAARGCANPDRAPEPLMKAHRVSDERYSPLPRLGLLANRLS
jgi:hypothetical protein